MKIIKSKGRFSVDGYLMADIATIITVLFFILFIAKKISIKYFFASLVITGSIGLLQAIFGKTQIKNKSGKVILAKDENTANIDLIQPDETGVDVDGITILKNNVTVNLQQDNIGTSEQSQQVSIEVPGISSSVSSPFVNPEGNATNDESISVYKIPDGVHAVVTTDDKVKINSLWGLLIYKIRGGQLTTPPDATWNKMFGINA